MKPILMGLLTITVLFWVGCAKKQGKTSAGIQPIEYQAPKEYYGLKKMIKISSGSFVMGSGKDTHTVFISSFYIDECPVTYPDFEQYVKEGGSVAKYWYYETYHQPEHPVSGVSWYHAADFCNWRSKKEGLTPAYKKTGQLDTWGYPVYEWDSAANGYRLPTEAEWEYAARGGLSQKNYPWGDDFKDEYANYDNEKGFKIGKWWRLATVKSQKQNGYGLYNMSGNVWQWCNDWYDENYYKHSPKYNPRGPKTGRTKVMRGGSWGSPSAKFLTVHYRSYNAPSNYNYEIGFRCVRPIRENIPPEKNKVKLIDKVNHDFYTYETSHYENPKPLDCYSDAFVERLTMYIQDFYPNCLYFHEPIDGQKVITPREMAALIVKVTKKYKIHPLFLTGIMASESGFASCSFPRWFNNPMAYHWQNVLMEKGAPQYAGDNKVNIKYKTLERGFENFAKGIHRPVYIRAARTNLDNFHLRYVGYRADEWMYTLSRLYKDVLGVRFEPEYPKKNAGALIFTDWVTQ